MRGKYKKLFCTRFQKLREKTMKRIKTLEEFLGGSDIVRARKRAAEQNKKAEKRGAKK